MTMEDDSDKKYKWLMYMQKNSTTLVIKEIKVYVIGRLKKLYNLAIF